MTEEKSNKIQKELKSTGTVQTVTSERPQVEEPIEEPVKKSQEND